MGDSITRMVLHCLHSSSIPTNINRTYLVLIHKNKNHEALCDYRPISLCIVLYKIIAKVLANHRKKVLPAIFFLTQSAFILGRLIIDNEVLVAFETLHAKH